MVETATGGSEGAVIPGARMLKMVVMKLIAPRVEVPIHPSDEYHFPLGKSSHTLRPSAHEPKGDLRG